MFSVPNGYIAGGTPDTIKQGTVLTFNCDPGSFIKHSSYSSKKQEEGTESVISSNPPCKDGNAGFITVPLTVTCAFLVFNKKQWRSSSTLESENATNPWEIFLGSLQVILLQIGTWTKFKQSYIFFWLLKE